MLVVDDVKTNVDILVHALRDEYKLSVALDGEAALRSIEKSPPDLVLLDIVMPGSMAMGSAAGCATESTRELPVMFLSSLEDVKDKTKGFEVGGNDYLTKPFEVLEVKARVRSLLKAELVRRRRPRGDGTRPPHRPRDPDGHPARRPRRRDQGHRPRRACSHRAGT